jgi:hypothetical protein
MEFWRGTTPRLLNYSSSPIDVPRKQYAEWLSLKKKPPCTKLVRARELENRSDEGADAGLRSTCCSPGGLAEPAVFPGCPPQLLADDLRPLQRLLMIHQYH